MTDLKGIINAKEIIKTAEELDFKSTGWRSYNKLNIDSDNKDKIIHDYKFKRIDIEISIIGAPNKESKLDLHNINVSSRKPIGYQENTICLENTIIEDIKNEITKMGGKIFIGRHPGGIDLEKYYFVNYRPIEGKEGLKKAIEDVSLALSIYINKLSYISQKGSKGIGSGFSG